MLRTVGGFLAGTGKDIATEVASKVILHQADMGRTALGISGLAFDSARNHLPTRLMSHLPTVQARRRPGRSEPVSQPC